MAQCKEHWIINQRSGCQPQFCVPSETLSIVCLWNERHHIYTGLRRLHLCLFSPQPSQPFSLPYYFPEPYLPLQLNLFLFSRYFKTLKGLWFSWSGPFRFLFLFFVVVVFFLIASEITNSHLNISLILSYRGRGELVWFHFFERVGYCHFF